jgi:hypothetical protein
MMSPEVGVITSGVCILQIYDYASTGIFVLFNVNRIRVKNLKFLLFLILLPLGFNLLHKRP